MPAAKPRSAPAPAPDAALVGEWVETAKLLPWVKNPRKNDAVVDRVVASIARFGFGNPILARRENGEVIAGHTRLKAALKMKMDRVSVRYLDLAETEAHLLALADNKLGELAEWDDAGLADILAQIPADDALIAGFDDAALAELLKLDPVEGVDTPDLEPPVNPVSVQGELYELGPHRLLCGDCRSFEDVTRLLAGERIGVAFTSPPYASQRAYDETSGFKPIRPDEFVEWFRDVQANVRAHLGEGGSWFVNIKEHTEEGQRSLYVKDLAIAHVREWGWAFVDELCWRNPSNGIPGGYVNRFKNAWEPVFHFSAGSEIVFHPESVSTASDNAFDYDPSIVVGLGVDGAKPVGGARVKRDGLARPSNVLEIKNDSTPSEHSARFPLDLPLFFVKAFSNPNAVIFDPFMGSGTTIIAAAKAGRRGFGTEISPRYCDVIRKRWGNYARSAGLDAGPGAL